MQAVAWDEGLIGRTMSARERPSGKSRHAEVENGPIVSGRRRVADQLTEGFGTQHEEAEQILRTMEVGRREIPLDRRIPELRLKLRVVDLEGDLGPTSKKALNLSCCHTVPCGNTSRNARKSIFS
jgi:hypothetical protein